MDVENNDDKVVNRTVFNKEYERFREFSLAVQNFNPNMCCSGSEKDAAEMATIMIGDCIKVTSVLVIIKPYCFSLWREILDVLMWLGFDVFFFLEIKV